MPKETVTVYIDDSAVRLVIAKGRSIQSWGDMPLERGLVKDGVILDQDAVAKKLQGLWQIAGKRKRYYITTTSGERVQVTEVVKPGKVIAGINGINCLHRLLTLPELPKDLLSEAVKREAARVFGVPLEELYLFWQVLPSLRGETVVYLVALPRDTVDNLISTLLKAGFKPYLMDLKPLALARTITEPNAIVVDVQPCSLDIVIMINRIPQVVRSIPLPREASLEDRMPVIGEELSRAILFYDSSHKDKPIGADVPLLVSGELAEREDIWSLLLDERERPVRVLPSPLEAPEDFPHSQYLTNIGLVLKEVPAAEKEAIPYSLVDFNALPEVYLPRRRPLSEIIYIAVSIIGIALIAWLAWSNITSSGRVGDLTSQLTAINLNIGTVNREISNVNRDISELQGWISVVEDHHDTLNQRIVKLNDDMLTLELMLATIDVDASSITQDMDSLNEHMDVLNEHMQELLINVSAVREVQADVAVIDQGLNILEQPQIEQLYLHIVILEEVLVPIIQDDLVSINQEITDLNQDIEELKEQVPLLEYDLTPINDAIDLLYLDIEGMTASITSIHTHIDSVNTALNAIATAVDFAAIRDEVNGDLDVIINHGMSVELAAIDHVINSVTVTGSAAHEDDIFSYADYLRASEEEDGSKRFALVVVTNITGEEGDLSFTLQLIK
jgi:type IV pilus assembly protein PilM